MGLEYCGEMRLSDRRTGVLLAPQTPVTMLIYSGCLSPSTGAKTGFYRDDRFMVLFEEGRIVLNILNSERQELKFTT